MLFLVWIISFSLCSPFVVNSLSHCVQAYGFTSMVVDGLAVTCWQDLSYYNPKINFFLITFICELKPCKYLIFFTTALFLSLSDLFLDYTFRGYGIYDTIKFRLNYCNWPLADIICTVSKHRKQEICSTFLISQLATGSTTANTTRQEKKIYMWKI